MMPPPFNILPSDLGEPFPEGERQIEQREAESIAAAEMRRKAKEPNQLAEDLKALEDVLNQDQKRHLKRNRESEQDCESQFQDESHQNHESQTQLDHDESQQNHESQTVKGKYQGTDGSGTDQGTDFLGYEHGLAMGGPPGLGYYNFETGSRSIPGTYDSQQNHESQNQLDHDSQQKHESQTQQDHEAPLWGGPPPFGAPQRAIASPRSCNRSSCNP